MRKIQRFCTNESEHSISIAAGVLFSADRRFAHHLRLNVGHPGARIDAALRELGALATEIARGGEPGAG